MIESERKRTEKESRRVGTRGGRGREERAQERREEEKEGDKR